MTDDDDLAYLLAAHPLASANTCTCAEARNRPYKDDMPCPLHSPDEDINEDYYYS